MKRIKSTFAIALFGLCAFIGCNQSTPHPHGNTQAQSPATVTVVTPSPAPGQTPIGVSAPYEVTTNPNLPVVVPQADLPTDNATDYKVLLVGINKYPGAELNGCVNDVNDMAAFLVTRGVPLASIRVITDGDATTARINKEIAWLVEGAKAGSVRLFHYSGHGAEYASANNAGEPNGLNQVICPVDFDWAPEHMIIDREFVNAFSKMPAGVLFNWFSDSCHSGDLTRRIPKPREKAKQYPIPAPVAQQVLLAKAKQKIHARGFVAGELDVGYISGCRSDQTSADAYFGDRPNGALTYYLLDSFKRDSVRNLRDVVKEINTNLGRDGYDQQPQGEGARINKPLMK